MIPRWIILKYNKPIAEYDVYREFIIAWNNLGYTLETYTYKHIATWEQLFQFEKDYPDWR